MFIIQISYVHSTNLSCLYYQTRYNFTSYRELYFPTLQSGLQNYITLSYFSWIKYGIFEITSYGEYKLRSSTWLLITEQYLLEFIS